ncbi:DNA-binding protein [Bacteroides gallinaceum]|uniref:DNA-binding protein n=1 Tax=Bacteroides gallinaceum TaxID=1462571 RepID=A0ABT7X406_9BACE|nr:DNA-binding protein [Bacteroides gallinaceum]MDN0048782.1 DNA-binding protein [Bacteroides gallinaceum]
MTDLMQIISNGAANIKLEITGEDLRVFSDELINRAINEVALAFRAADEERLLSREEVKDMCGVYDATLWNRHRNCRYFCWYLKNVIQERVHF